MSCAIHEAFPEYEIDEIDNWDIAKACEYMAKAEFILHNLRGVPLNPMEQMPQEEETPQPVRQPDTRQPKTHEISDMTPTPKKKTESAPSKKSKLSPQKLAELQARFPTIDWSNDNAIQGIQGFMHQDVDARSRLELNTESSSYVDGSGQDALPPAMRSRFKVIGDLTEDALQGKPE
jgi:hypothetical protein